MVIRRVNPISLAKVSAMLYAVMGFIIGAIISLASLVSSALLPRSGAFGNIFGVGAIIALPIFYGALGFVMSLIAAYLYNLIAGWVGGVEIDVQ